MDGRVEADVLALMEQQSEPICLGGEEAVINSLGFLDWLLFDSSQVEFMLAVRSADVVGMVAAANRMLETATDVSPGEMGVGEALVALPLVLKLNELRFVDPSLLMERVRRVEDTAVEWKNRMVLDFVATLAKRFSMQEIREMQPTFAILMWQHIREEDSLLLDAVFYSSEIGYTRHGDGKNARLRPRPSPFAPYWLEGKRKRMQRVLALPAGVPEEELLSPFVTQPGRVVDMATGKRLREEEEKDD